MRGRSGAESVCSTANMDIETRKKRILYRASHRGTKEADHIVGGFFAARTAGLQPDQLDDADRILDLLDVDLMDWIIKKQPVPDDMRSVLLDELVAFGRAKG
ncbi:MAG: succinate dehydrogenase assembly factor 2 [Rhodospirillaceae bacterium]|nr:succinate dehydrogenase assembly factor 2 [Rhodospirillaceae bacterium]